MVILGPTVCSQLFKQHKTKQWGFASTAVVEFRGWNERNKESHLSLAFVLSFISVDKTLFVSSKSALPLLCGNIIFANRLRIKNFVPSTPSLIPFVRAAFCSIFRLK
jgi:hypothetical protein